MSLKGKNRAVFSYNGKDKSNSNFMYKDFEKSNSYHSSFRASNFNYATLRSAKMKFCDFSEASFVGTEFVGTNLRGSNFTNAVFNQSIFVSTVLERANFKGASFKDCYFICTGIGSTKFFPEERSGITFLNKMPNTDNFSSELLAVVESLRTNDIIRRSHALHVKEGKVNTLSLLILKTDFCEDELIRRLPQLPSLLSTQFYTLSYLRNVLKKAT